jgi:hypothetical protein
LGIEPEIAPEHAIGRAVIALPAETALEAIAPALAIVAVEIALAPATAGDPVLAGEIALEQTALDQATVEA